MASYTTSFSSWSGFEAVLSAAQAYESSGSFASIKISLENLQAHASADPVSQTGTSSSVTLVYADGVVANVFGFSFGTPGAVITRIEITDGLSTVSMNGFVSAQNISGIFSSYSFSGFGYSESGSGQIPLDGRPAVLSSWSSTLPTTLGYVSLSATGTSTISSDTVSSTYASVTISDNAGHSAQLTGLNYSISGSASSEPDYVQIMHDMLSGDDTANGSFGAEELRTFAGNDSLDGQFGADTLSGGTGNDTYVVDNAGDVVVEQVGEGVDLIQSSLSFTLPGNVENLTLTGFNVATATGNETDNDLRGSAADNVLSGNGGNDTLTGGGGHDTLNGGAGSDTAIFSGTRAQYLLSPISTGWTLSGPDGLDTLTGIGFAQFSDQTISLGNYAPGGAVTITGIATQNETLTASNTLTDLNGLGTISYQWKAAGIAISGATASTLVLTQAQVGKVITVTASYTDGQGTAESVTSSATGAVANINDAPTIGLLGNRTAGLNEALSLNMGMLFSDPDGDTLSFGASGLPAGLAIDTATGLITGTTPNATGVHHITVTGTDTSSASASLNFDLSILTGHTATTSVISRSGAVLPGVTAYELISTTPSGSLYGFKNVSVDTNVSTGIKTLTADLFASGSGTEHQSAFTLQGAAGATLQSFQLTGAVTTANGWNITEGHPAGGYTLAATHASSSIAVDTLIGKLTLALPATATGNSILDFSDAMLGDTSAPSRSLSFFQEDMGGIGQLNSTLPDSSLALSLSRGTSDYLVNGTTKPITAADALDALKLSVGLAASKGSSWKELISADMNHDGRVTAADALEILKTSVGVNTIQPSWVFVPNDAGINPNLSSMTRTTVSYKDDLNLSSITAPTSAAITGILVGDVNNSWVIPA